MTTTTRTRPLIDRLEFAMTGCADIDSLAARIFATIKVVVPFDFACLATTDPASELITRAIKSRPLPIGDEDFAAAEYGAPDVNQLADIARRSVPVGVLSIDTDGQLDRCRRFRDFMAPTFGFTDELRLVCRARGTTWCALALYRGAGEPPFSAAEAEQLAQVHELVANGVQRVLFASKAGGTATGSGAAVLIVDAADRISDLTASARERIDELGGWDNGSLPANVLAAVALARTTQQPAKTRVQARSGRWLVLQAMTLRGDATTDAATAGRSVVVTIDSAAPAEIGKMTLAARGLTAREQDVAHLVLQGASTRTIAASLYLSPHTVQDHLKAIFRKLEVSSRREMIGYLIADEARAGSGR